MLKKTNFNKSKSLCIVIALLCIPMLASAEQFTFKFDSFSVEKKQGFDILKLEKTDYRNNVGEPLLPVVYKYIILPYGKDVKKITSKAKSRVLSGKYNIPPIPDEVHSIDQMSILKENPEIYEKDELFPYANYYNLGVHRKNGVDILIVQVFPFQYNPKKKVIMHNREITLNIKFKNALQKEEEQTKSLLPYPNLSKIFDNSFLNLHALISYKSKSQKYKMAKSSLVSADNPYDYIIITNSALESEWDSLVTQKIDLGLAVNTYTTEDIYANYTGADNQDKIRNFIIDAYTVWSGTGHPLQWVLLGGDSGIVPSRKVRVAYQSGETWYTQDIDSDNYYAGLDGNWDNDGDGIYGEGDNAEDSHATGMAGEEVDWFAEVYIGRASLQNATEIDNWMTKSITYENLSIDDYLKSATLVGEYLGNNVNGGDYQNEIAVYLPQFNHTKLYNMLGTYSKDNVIDAINDGTHFISHIGHGSSAYVFDMYDSDVQSLTNTDYCMIYTQACNTGHFTSSCIAESFIEKEHGTFAFLGNTGYGFYSTFYNQGSSQYLNREFFDAIMNEDLTNIGSANADSKEDIVGIIGAVGSRRYVALGFTLFGDPNLSLHKDISDVSAEQTDNDEVVIHYVETPGTGAGNKNNYEIYERDDTTATVNILSASISGNDITLTLENDLSQGIPYNVKISNVSTIKNPTIRPIDVFGTILEMSIISPTTLTPDGNPYYIYDNFFVRDTLKIESGVVIKINSGIYFNIWDGALQADGTSENPIIFTSYSDEPQPGDWGDITFEPETQVDATYLKYCILEYGTNGIYFYKNNGITIENCQFYNMSSFGMYIDQSSPTIKRTVIAFNGGASGYGIYSYQSSPVIEHCDIYGNSNYGIKAMSSSNLTITNSIIYANTGQIYKDFLSIINITYSDIEGGYTGTGNISDDPLFVNPDSCNFNITQYSPCINSGDPSFALDADSTIADIGVFYFDLRPDVVQNLNISASNSNITLYWDEVTTNIFGDSLTVDKYRIYGSGEPYAGFVQIDSTYTNTWNGTDTSQKKFYQVRAVKE
ncbi:MAG: hypothetical protein DRH57_03985 [Candidatus Cloacimonadota bacterium]|nr:MAG: hypothetical protein DRH57_03985 [Candidatus Cloacimonadota bacterium]